MENRDERIPDVLRFQDRVVGVPSTLPRGYYPGVLGYENLVNI